jgi:hypothetical protein
MQQTKQRQIIDEYPDYQGYEDLPGNDEYQEYAEDEIETLYLYAYDPEKPFWHIPRWNKDQWIAAMMGVFVLAMGVGLCIFLPMGQAYSIQTVTVQVNFHTQAFVSDITIVPTGIQHYPALQASGKLTIYNGSILSQQLPSGFILTAQDGTEVATNAAITIPGANLPSLGIASVSAHSILAGRQGNIQAYAIQATYGSSIEIKNLSAFTGGQDSYTKTYVTSEDTAKALETAKAQVSAEKPIGLLAQPCTETTSHQALNLSVTLSCEYVTYPRPAQGQILSVQISGDTAILKIKVLAQNTTIHFVK